MMYFFFLSVLHELKSSSCFKRENSCVFDMSVFNMGVFL